MATTIHPLPSGTRDVLPDEMRELRAITAAVLDVFTARGYGEVSTPALEHQEVLERGGGAQPAYRVMDDHGHVLALRPDMTVPIARLVATRYATEEPPLRFCYLADVYRGVRPHRGQMREFLQAGVELIGVPAPQGTVEMLRVLCAALDAAGLTAYRVGVGDAAIYPTLLANLDVPAVAREALLRALGDRDFVGLERELRRLDLSTADRETLATVPSLRGGVEVLRGRPATEGLRRVHALLEPAVAERVLFDLGLARGLGYYTGAVFEVYDPALGEPLGGGGRYDDLLARFGRPLPAVGFALGVDKLHIALAGEEGGP